MKLSNLCNKFVFVALFYINCIVFCSAFQCPYLFEEGRQSCSVRSSTRAECEGAGCCWDEDSEDSSVQCHERECNDGYFGWGCKFQCYCKFGAICDKLTGECPRGCDSDRWGVGCLLGNECMYNDPKGIHYQGKQTSTANNYVCGLWTRTNAYQDSSMPEKNKTLAQNFCRNPQPSDKQTWCYYKLGRNRKWDYCDLGNCDCPSGRWGINCQYECHCDSPSEECNSKNGLCQTGCDYRWQGAGCQECADGQFGANCGFECNCNDPTEVCSKVTGECNSGCRTGFSGSACQIEIPRLVNPPKKVRHTANSVSIRWSSWKNPPDTGDGPVNSYEVRYKDDDAEIWQRLETENLSAFVQNLEPRKMYVFKVLPIHEQGFVGYASPEIRIPTCSAPKGGPENLRYKVVDADNDDNLEVISVTVLWQVPNDRAMWGCDRVEGFRVYTKELDSDDFTFYKTTPLLRIPIENIDPYKNFTIGVSLVNSAKIESVKSLITYVGLPGPVQNMGIQPSATSFFMSWNPPLEPNGQLEYYIYRYRVQEILSCGNTGNDNNWKPRVDLPGSETEWFIEDLLPNTRYQVKLWANTEAGKGEQVLVTETTNPAPPSEKVESVFSSQVEKRKADFQWEAPPCETRNGDFIGFSYELRRGDASGTIVKQATINATSVSLESLVPFTEYAFRVSFKNQIGDGPKSDPVIIKTHEDIPTAPRNVQVTMQSSSSLTVSWQPPYPPHGVIKNYDLKYWENAQIPSVKRQTLPPNQLEFHINNLEPNSTYTIQVQASTVLGGGNWSEKVVGFTEENYPSEPTQFTNSSRGVDTLTLRWGPPAQANGELKKYKLSYVPAGSVSPFDNVILIDPTIMEYTIEGLSPSTQYVCRISAKTKKGYGPETTGTFWTKPNIPEAPSEPVIQIEEMTDHTATIKIKPAKVLAVRTENSHSKYQVVVQILGAKNRKRRETTSYPCGLSHNALTTYKEALALGHDCYIAAELDAGDSEIPFVVGDNKTYGDYYNAPLQKGHEYNLWFGVVVSVDGETQASYTKTETSMMVSAYSAPTNSDNTALMAGGAVGALIVVLIILLVIIFVVRYRKYKRTDKPQELDVSRLMPTTQRGNSECSDTNRGNNDMISVITDEGDNVSAGEDEPLYENTDQMRKPIAIENLWDYIQNAQKNNGFKLEYDNLQHGLRTRCDVAKKPENKAKNRYGNIIAYDHSRVVLECQEDDPHSDYINANYIDAYRRTNAYIATQGPNKFTLNDIWRMTWQLNSTRIVMVSNLVEDGRHKCEMYWPDAEPKIYGDILVTKTEQQQFADFTIRVFTMTVADKVKTVRQFHFTAWPDHGVPLYATSLLAFRKKVRSFDDPTAGPAIVHCSAGVGRSGTFMALDYLLDQAKVEGQIDVFSCIELMRTKRVNMVQTLDQYIFVYDALLEALKSGETSILCVDFRKKYLDLTKNNPESGKPFIQEEYELLGLLSPSPEVTGCKDAHTPDNIGKNRCKEIVPLDNLARVYIYTYIPGSTDYINAVYTDGYRQRDAFLLTQHPMPNTIIDFWAMMSDQDIRTVVMMNEHDPKDETVAIYFPEKASKLTIGPFTIETVSVNDRHPEIVVRDINLSCSKKNNGEIKQVRHFQYVGWPNTIKLPPKKTSIISLLQMVEKWQQRSGNGSIAVHCLDGASRSGLYCSVSYMVERLKAEQEIDVFQTVKHLRINRPQIIPDIDQYRFVYDMAEEYMDCFETYANFK